jgi:hypothetical protein
LKNGALLLLCAALLEHGQRTFLQTPEIFKRCEIDSIDVVVNVLSFILLRFCCHLSHLPLLTIAERTRYICEGTTLSNHDDGQPLQLPCSCAWQHYRLRLQ